MLSITKDVNIVKDIKVMWESRQNARPESKTVTPSPMSNENYVAFIFM